MPTIRPYCISIAGFDPSAGAGILADVKVFESLYTYGFGVISAITYQNDTEFNGVNWCDFEQIQAQIDALQKYPIAYAKIGLIENSETLTKIIHLLKLRFPTIFIIWDSIIKASAGFDFHTNEQFPQELFESINLITPNYDEYIHLKLDKLSLEQTAILVKGGHKTNEHKGVDTLFYTNKIYNISGDAFTSESNKHGTGCVLSAAITAYMSKGENLLQACTKAKQYVEKFMQSNTTNLGYHSI